METLINKKVSEIVAENYQTAQIFENHKIDFCCNGGRILDEVCDERGLNKQLLVEELEKVLQHKNEDSQDFNTWPLDKLTLHIEEKHHRYVDEVTPVLAQYLNKLCRVHGSQHHELFEITQLFNISAGDLTMHMKKEEFILFPFIRKMVKASENHEKIEKPNFGSVENPVHMMEHEHEEEGKRFRKIRTLSNNYTVPDDGCNTYKVTMDLLKAFEEDLHLHIHLENNILFPKSITLEKTLT